MCQARLHVVAVVPRPYSRDALRAIYADAGMPADLKAGASLLIDQWPHLLPGQHRLRFDEGRVSLTVLFGAPEQTLARAGFVADGFYCCPPRPESLDLARWIGHIGRHASPQAWWICNWRSNALEHLLRQTAFAVRAAAPMDAPGMTVADRRSDVSGRIAPQVRPAMGGRRAVVIGAGISGAHVAYVLASRGWSVDVVAGATPHAGHVAAAMTPVVSIDDNPRARLTRAGALLARSLWAQLPPDATRFCGTVQLDAATTRDGATAETLNALQFPPGWVRAVSRAQAGALCGVPVARGGAYFSQGALVRPDRLIAHLLAHPRITHRLGAVNRVQAADGVWRVLDAGSRVLAEGDHVVLSTGRDTPDVLRASGLLAADATKGLAAMHAMAGEISFLHSPAAPLARVQRVLGGEGYLLPGVHARHVIGSTYVRGAELSEVSPAGQDVNLGKAAGLIGASIEALRPALVDGGWAGWRAVVPGRLPVIGAWPETPGVWVATAYASRGLTWAALAGEMIAAALHGEPDVVETDLARKIAPSR